MTIPVTLLTGFLGAGKTTLLNHILGASHGQRIAVIENEFGPVNIDSDILIREAGEVIEMTNGCLCCSIRGDLAGHLAALIQARDGGEISFHRLVIETTGLADPTPIAQTFFASPELAEHYQLDGVITVVDALNAPRQLEAHAVVRRQIGFADRLLLSKADLVDEEALQTLSARLTAMNGLAAQYRLDRGSVDLAVVFDIRGFHLDDTVPDITTSAGNPLRRAGQISHGGFLRAGAARPSFNDDIAALHLQHAGPLDLGRIGAFMNELLDNHGDDLLRHKGVLALNHEPRRLIFQGVHRISGFDYGREWGDTPPRSDIVLIGRDLPAAQLREAFARCVMGENHG